MSGQNAVRSLQHLNGQWCLITEKRDEVASQVMLVGEGEEWPADRIQKFIWSSGRRIFQVQAIYYYHSSKLY